MSDAAMNAAYWQYTGATLNSTTLDSFRAGWKAAMRFMAQPRIPVAEIPKPMCPKCGSDKVYNLNPRDMLPEVRCYADGCDYVALTLAPKEHNPLQRQYYVPTPVHPAQDQLAERFTRITCLQCHLTKGLAHADLYPELWMTLTFADGRVNHYCCPTCLWVHIQKMNAAVEAKVRPAKEHNPHGLVAFCTDAPDV